MDEQAQPAPTPKVAYIVTLSEHIDSIAGGEEWATPAETLVLVPAETRAKAHLLAQQQCRERQGWLRPRIIESLRLPGEPAEATRLFTQIVGNHLRPAVEGEGDRDELQLL